MSVTPGTIRSREELASSEAIRVPSRDPQPLPRARVEPAQVMEAARRADALIHDAERKAAALLDAGRQELEVLRQRVTAEARAEATASVAAQALALASREATLDERSLDRLVALARVLAERLLGEELALDPGRVVGLAKTALAEARGARRVVLTAHPEDVPALERAIAEGRLTHVTRVVGNAARQRGALRLESEIGVLDAALAPQLDRLLARLRETLRHEP